MAPPPPQCVVWLAFPRVTSLFLSICETEERIGPNQMDKRQPYDYDTRIHLLAVGPGIKPGSTWAQPATQVDMAPTYVVSPP
eukprot:COSAG01_NODE_3548_length_5952_cov_7.082564_4_plen_82_part_00